MYSALLFIVLIIVLSAVRSRLVFELSGISLLLFGSTRPGVIVYSIMVLPGTIIHELSHWVVAEVLQVPTGEISILPDFSNGEEKRQKLGHVMTASADPLRSFVIGIAPFVSGLGLLALFGYLFSTWWARGYPWWSLALLGYGIMVVGNSMMISKEDRRSWPVMFILSGGIVYALYRAGVSFQVAEGSVLTKTLTSLNIVLGVTLALNLGIIALSHLGLGVIEKLTHKRIVHK